MRRDGRRERVTNLGWETVAACHENGRGMTRIRVIGGVTEMGRVASLSGGVARWGGVGSGAPKGWPSSGIDVHIQHGRRSAEYHDLLKARHSGVNQTLTINGSPLFRSGRQRKASGLSIQLKGRDPSGCPLCSHRTTSGEGKAHGFYNRRHLPNMPQTNKSRCYRAPPKPDRHSTPLVPMCRLRPCKNQDRVTPVGHIGT
jgi:hypothetical protein